jgi:HEAT repeats
LLKGKEALSMEHPVRTAIVTGLLVAIIAVISGGSAWAAQQPGFLLSVRGNQLSAQIEKRALGDVMTALAQQTGLEISVDRSVAHSEVTVAFENLPLEEAIQHLMGDNGYALTFAQTTSGNHLKIVAISIFSKGVAPHEGRPGGNAAAEPPSTSDGGEKVNRNSLTGTELVTQPDTNQVQEGDLLLGLQAEDSHVREASLEKLGKTRLPLPLEPLTEMALKDSSTQLRMEALQLLSARGGDVALEPLKQAVGDPDPAVSLLAKGLLDERMEAIAEALREKNEEGGVQP